MEEKQKKVIRKKKGRKVRVPLIDSVRGLVLISMILFHGSWNLVYLYKVSWPWYQYSKGAYYWQQSICWTFILLSGFCFSMGKRKLRNGLLVFASGVLVSLTTALFMPENMVRFGVLTCIGSCILITLCMEPLLLILPKVQAGVISFLLFLFTAQINTGYLGYGILLRKKVPGEWYSSLVSAYLGFPPKGFTSTDYFSLLPWIFLFWTGFFAFHGLKNKRFWEIRIMKIRIPVVSWLGRHSLFVYLIHQPVLLLLGEVCYRCGLIKI